MNLERFFTKAIADVVAGGMILFFIMVILMVLAGFGIIK